MSTPFIGTQVSLASFHRFGVTRILDLLQAEAGVNTIRLHADDRVRSAEEFFSLEGETPETNLCGVPLDPANYRDTAVRCQAYMGKLPAARRLGLLEELRRELDARGMQLQVRCIIGPDAKRESFSAMLSRNEDGELVPRPCNFNPHYLGFLRGVAEDVFRTSPVRVDGYVHMYEMNGVLGGMLVGGHIRETCFCPHCRQRALSEGIDAEAARAGVRAMKRRVDQALVGERPLGLTGWHGLLLDHPEVLAWDAMQWRGYHESIAAVRGIARTCQPEARVGLHVHHTTSWSFTERAGYRPETLGASADFIKPILYHTFTGLRAGGAITRFRQLLMPQAGHAEAMRTFLWLNGCDPDAHPVWTEETPEGELDAADYVAANLRHYTETPGFRTPLYANVGWEDEYAETPAPDPRETQTYRAVRAAIGSGAQGIFLSRQFSPEHAFGQKVPRVSLLEASAGGTKTHADGDVGPRSLAAYGAALRDAGWIP